MRRPVQTHNAGSRLGGEARKLRFLLRREVDFHQIYS
jgi:hypothetical protein